MSEHPPTSHPERLPGESVLQSAQVSGQPLLPANLCVSTDWGSTSGGPGELCRIVIVRASVVKALVGYYDAYVEDGRRHPPDSEDWLERQILAAGSPDMTTLMSDHPRLFEAFVVECAHDFLVELFRSSRPSNAGYAICEVTNAAVNDETVVLHGRAEEYGE